MSDDVGAVAKALIARGAPAEAGVGRLLHGRKPGAEASGRVGRECAAGDRGRNRRVAFDGPCAFGRRAARSRQSYLRNEISLGPAPAHATQGGACIPGVYDLRYLRGLRSLRDFDDQITARYCGFLDAQDYYTRASASNVVDRIAVPTLILHAEDDPFIRILPASREKLLHNPHITYIETEHGGHCAFLAEANGYDGRWAERQAIAFLQRVERGEALLPAQSAP